MNDCQEYNNFCDLTELEEQENLKLQYDPKYQNKYVVEDEENSFYSDSDNYLEGFSIVTME